MVFSTFNIEKSLWSAGFNFIAGLDEVGRGSFAGPVVAGAVVFPENCNITGLADSKLLKKRQREKLSLEIKKSACFWTVVEISVPVINKIGIGKATQMAFRKAIKSLEKYPDFVLIDAFFISHFNRKIQRPVKDGDKICASISAASIIAKVYRDDLMKGLHKKYPEYKFGKHKGYGTALHREMIKLHGLSKVHRKSFDLEKFL